MLVQVVLFVFVLFGVLSIVVDIGYARLTQVQMQNAVEAAAIEGLRFRDAVSDDAGEPDGYAGDCMRRVAARDVVRWTFDDDFITTSGGELDPTLDARQFGAGPVLDLDGGETDLYALQTVSQPGVHVYKPDPQLNQADNRGHGDLVSGSFDPLDPQHVENEAYERTDFTPGSALAGSNCEPSGNGPATDLSFLARLRRINDFQRQDLDDEPGVSSGGSPLPLLFGRLSTISAPDVQTAYSVRRDGLTVRAAAIAHLRPALRVGVDPDDPSDPAGIHGVTPFVLSSGFLTSLDGAAPVIVLANGEIWTNVEGDPGAHIGWFVETPRLTTVGDLAGPAAAAACGAVVGYVPAYESISGASRIVGFFHVAMTWPPNCDPRDVTIRRAGQRVAPANATAHVAGGFPANLSPGDLSDILATNRSLAFDANGQLVERPALLAPILVR